MKKIKIIGIFGTFALCFLTHFLYQLLPCTFTSIFFPVNESIWEHMKMLFTTVLLYNGLEYIYIKVKKIDVNNFSFATVVSATASIPIFLLMFLPIYYSIGENMPITFILLFITIIIVQFINYKITVLSEIPYQTYFSITYIIIAYIIFGYLTYNPPKTDLFFDTEDEKYGINIYTI